MQCTYKYARHDLRDVPDPHLQSNEDAKYSTQHAFRVFIIAATVILGQAFVKFKKKMLTFN